MADFKIAIVKNKVLKDGRHTVRISVCHNGVTRFIPTHIVIDNENEIKNGRIVKRPDRAYLNSQLNKIINDYEQRTNNILYSDAISCSQLVSLLKGTNLGCKKDTFKSVAEEYMKNLLDSDRTGTYNIMTTSLMRFYRAFNQDIMLKEITPLMMVDFINILKKEYSDTTVHLTMENIKAIINYAIKLNYIRYDVHPFTICEIPAGKRRDTYITVDELRRLRDMQFDSKVMNVSRDLFMLTYYLAGMNYADLTVYRFDNLQYVKYIRKKTARRKKGEGTTMFSIPDEAKTIIKKYIGEDKLLHFNFCRSSLLHTYEKIGKELSIDHQFTLYSARKSFVQHGYELGIPLSTLEYCIGHTMKENRPIFSYLSLNMKFADEAIRKIIDNLNKK